MENLNKPKNTEDHLVKQMGKKSKTSVVKISVLLLVVVLLGAGSGFLITKGTAKTTTSTTEATSSKDVEKGTALGSNDTSTFKDTAEGVMTEGGIEGEGQYHLVRPGGASQNVYLTSSAVDLSLVLDKKVKVWGQTQKAQHAGWLMDVGRVEVLE
jgi:hypothetical protein